MLMRTHPRTKIQGYVGVKTALPRSYRGESACTFVFDGSLRAQRECDGGAFGGRPPIAGFRAADAFAPSQAQRGFSPFVAWPV